MNSNFLTTSWCEAH